MADPVSIIGAVAASAQILTGIATTVRNLVALREKYKSANVSISGVIQRLTTIKHAIGSIKDSAEIGLIAVPDEQLKRDLDIAIDGCHEAMLSLSTDITHFTTDGSPRNLSFGERTRYILIEKTMRDHEHGLLCHVQALSILLTAVQSRTVTERREVLTRGENEHVFQRVEDDAISLRESRARSTQGSVTTMSIRGAVVSAETIESLSMRSGIAPAVRRSNARISESSPLAQEALHVDAGEPSRGFSSVERVAQFLAEPGSHAGSQRGAFSERSRNLSHDDEGYESKSTTDTTSSRLSPGWTPIGERLRSPPTEVDTLPEGSDIYSPRDGMPRQARTQPVEVFGAVGAEERQARLLKKPSTWFTGFHRRRPSTEARTPSPTNESAPFKPRSRHVSRSSSIDFSSEDGLSAPPLVRAAQAGSLVEVEQLLERYADIEAVHARTGRNALTVAAHCGNTSTVNVLLQAGARPNCQDALGSTPLHLAASRDHVDVMKLLLKGGANVEERDFSGTTPLWIAASQGHTDAAKLLLSAKAKVNSRASDQTPVLHAAVKNGDTYMIQLLIAHGAHVDAKDGDSLAPIHHACKGGVLPVAEALLRANADVEAVGNNQMTPFLTAAAAGQSEIIKTLISRKVNLKKKGDMDMTALHWACFNGHVDTVEMLIASKKLSLDACTTHGRTPLHLAVSKGRFDVVELLLRRIKKSDVDATCYNGFTPLHYACSTKDRAIVQLLISSGANIEAMNKIDGARPLHIAATHNDVDVVRVLLRHHPELDARDHDDGRALWIACFHGHIEVAKLLLNAGSPMRGKFQGDGQIREDSPLCIAARQGHEELCWMLIEEGASVREKDENGWNPLRYAAHFGHPDIVEMLLARGAELGGASGGWGFELNAERIGFSNEVSISQERKDLVMALLLEAEQLETQSRANDEPVDLYRTGTVNRNRPSELSLDPVSEHTAFRRQSVNPSMEMPDSKFTQGIYRSKTRLAPPPPPPPPHEPTERDRPPIPQSIPTSYPAPPPSVSVSSADGDEDQRYQYYRPSSTYLSGGSSYDRSPAPSTVSFYEPDAITGVMKYRVADSASSMGTPSPYSSRNTPSMDSSQQNVQRSSTQLTTTPRPSSEVSRSMSGGLRYRNPPSHHTPSSGLGRIQEDTGAAETIMGDLTFFGGAYQTPNDNVIHEIGPSEPALSINPKSTPPRPSRPNPAERASNASSTLPPSDKQASQQPSAPVSSKQPKSVQSKPTQPTSTPPASTPPADKQRDRSGGQTTSGASTPPAASTATSTTRRFQVPSFFNLSQKEGRMLSETYASSSSRTKADAHTTPTPSAAPISQRIPFSTPSRQSTPDGLAEIKPTMVFDANGPPLRRRFSWEEDEEEKEREQADASKHKEGIEAADEDFRLDATKGKEEDHESPATAARLSDQQRAHLLQATVRDEEDEAILEEVVIEEPSTQENSSVDGKPAVEAKPSEERPFVEERTSTEEKSNIEERTPTKTKPPTEESITGEKSSTEAKPHTEDMPSVGERPAPEKRASIGPRPLNFNQHQEKRASVAILEEMILDGAEDID